jgi:hypothetical protein
MGVVVCTRARRCWLYLSKEIGAVLDALPENYQIHIIWAVAKRAKEQDMVLCRLALFLDPRFRQAALAGGTDLNDFTTRASKWGYAQVCCVSVRVCRQIKYVCAALLAQQQQQLRCCGIVLWQQLRCCARKST